MKKLIPLILVSLLVAACAKGKYQAPPAKPADIPPPTDLLAQ